MTQKTERICRSGEKMLGVLDVLSRNYYHGYTPTEISRETGLALSDINTYVNTLIKTGFAERIQETGRIRPGAAKYSQVAAQILYALERGEISLQQCKQNITKQ
ncbi:MAG: transcriptional regulator [Methylomonas sp.]|nr:MAG: transcriptional regulator [Methylomonas sp.]